MLLSPRLRTPLLLAAALLCAFIALPGCDGTIRIGDESSGDGPLAVAAENAGAWAWVPVEDAKCRDGSDTGFGARLREGSTRLLIYLEGGGACFNGATCRNNRDRFGRATFTAFAANTRADAGLFDTTRRENPVASWNTAYVPYCTGDVHAGSARDVRIEGVDANGDDTPAPQQFVGHRNVERYLSILADRFAGKVDRVLLTGSSAGGYGAIVNYEAAHDAFPDARVTLLDDSGPPVADDDVLTPELEARWTDLWDLNEALSAEARAAVEDGGLAALYHHYARRYPDETFGLLSHRKDATIRDFYGYQQPGCDDPAQCVSGGAYARALENVRDEEAPSWATYYAAGYAHTFLLAPRFYDTEASSVPLSVWMEKLLNDEGQDVSSAQN